MRILLVNKYYYLRGGAERYLLNLKKLLERQGHRVEVFAMAHPQNLPATYAADFVPYLDFRRLSFGDRLRAAGRVIWFPEAARCMERVLDKFQPDVVHLSNIYHQLSPAILPPITRRRIPVVYTLHDYKLLCPNYLLYTRGRACTRCRSGHYWAAARYRCLHDSLSWSLLAAVEMILHKRWRVYERHVSTFVTPSAFVKSMAEAFGIPSGQLLHIPHFLFPEEYPLAESDQGYIAYIGRLTREKGLPALIRAMVQVPQAQLVVVGEGLMRPVLERLAADLGLANVRFTGYLSGPDLDRMLAGARLTVLPSEWYEVFGLSIIESLAVGKPVAGARMGAIPELIEEGVNGLLFRPGDVDEIAAGLAWLWDHPDQAARMGLQGRQKVLTQYTAEQHYQKLYSLYESYG